MKNKNEGYIKASLRERLLLSEFNKRTPFTLLETTKSDEFKKYDAIILSGNPESEYIVEIKTRVYDGPLGYYNGYVIEKNKYDYLLLQHKELGLTPLYINFFANGALVWNLLEVTEPTWRNKLYQRDDQSMNKEMIEKDSGDLLTSEAHKYEMQLPIIAASEKAAMIYNKYEKTFK